MKSLFLIYWVKSLFKREYLLTCIEMFTRVCVRGKFPEREKSRGNCVRVNVNGEKVGAQPYHTITGDIQ